MKARSLYQAFILLDEFKLNKNEFQQLYNIYLELNEEERHILLPLVLVFQNANNMESGQA